MAANTAVKIGGQDYTIQRFRGLKAILAMAALTRIAREVPDIFAQVNREYKQRNTITITEPMARLPRWEGFSKEDFDEAERTTGKREIELPEPMSQQEQVLAALPLLLEQARKEVVRLLAILVIPNSELREADEADKVDTALDQYKEVLLYEADLDELGDLVLVAQDVLAEQLGNKRDRLGKLLGSLTRTIRQRASTETPAPLTPIPTSLEEADHSTRPTSPPEAPTGSISSASTTDGAEAEPSTVSPG